MSNWFYRKDGRIFGPILDAELRQLVAQGLLAPGDLVRSGDARPWQPVSDTPWLKGESTVSLRAVAFCLIATVVLVITLLLIMLLLLQRNQAAGGGAGLLAGMESGQSLGDGADSSSSSGGTSNDALTTTGGQSPDSTNPQPGDANRTNDSAPNPEGDGSSSEIPLPDQIDDEGTFELTIADSASQLAGDGKSGDFLGIRSVGNSFVYVVDKSGSMNGTPFELACRELVDSISRLQENQSFYVIFYSNNAEPMFMPADIAPKMLAGTDKNKQLAKDWIAGIFSDGGTNPTEAMRHAINLNPEVIFLMSDGSFNMHIADGIRQDNLAGIVINTIAYGSDSGKATLEKIARENNGQYHYALLQQIAVP